MVKNLPAMRETGVWSLGWDDPLEKEMATQSSILARRIPWTKEPGRLQSMGLQSQTRLSNYHSLKEYKPQEKVISPTVYKLPGQTGQKWDSVALYCDFLGATVAHMLLRTAPSLTNLLNAQYLKPKHIIMPSRSIHCFHHKKISNYVTLYRP